MRQDILHDLVQKHFASTGSLKAKALLDDWDASLDKFVKVFPNEYRKALIAAENSKEA